MPPRTSKEIEDKIEELSYKNMTVTEVAKSVGVTPKVVNRVKVERGLTFAKGYNSRPSKDFELEIVDLYNKGHNTNYISNLKSISQLQVARILKRNGIKSIPRNQLNITKEEEVMMCELYNKGFSTNDIAFIFNDKVKCDHTVSKILKKNGVEVGISGTKAIVLNEDYFENIDSENKAYLLGFIYADGNVRVDKRGNHLFQIEIEESDSFILELIRDELGCFVKSKDFENLEVKLIKKPINVISRAKFNCGKTSNTKSLQVVSKKLYDDLGSHGVFPNKTFNISFPYESLNDDMIRHFIRGYFDGDGSANCSNGRGRVTFYGQENFLNSIKDLLSSTLNTNDVKVFNKKTVSMLSYGSKKDVQSIYNYFYDNSTLYLKRKKEKLQPYVNTEITN